MAEPARERAPAAASPVARLVSSPPVGGPLRSPVRTALERSLGVNLDSVRIPTGTATGRVVDAMPARAFAQGTLLGLPALTRETHHARNEVAPGPSAPGVGAPMPDPVRSRLERSFGTNLSGVRVHTGTDSQHAASALSARAFAYGNHVFLGASQRATDVGLMAHETAHVLQQRSVPSVQLAAPRPSDPLEHEAERASAAVLRGEQFTIREHVSHPRVQRLGIRDALDYFADRAYNIPGFRMFTIVLGVNPITMARVERSAANILRAVIELIPGGGLVTQALDTYGIVDRVGGWVDEQIQTLGMTGGLIRQAIDQFLDSLSWRDIFNLGDVWDRAVRIFTVPIDRIISFGRGLVSGIIRFVKEAILRPLARLAEGTRGYDLLKAVLGFDPITGDTVPRTAETLIGGFMRLIGQEEVWNNLKQARAVPRAWAWFQGTLTGVLAFVRNLPQLFLSALQQLELGDIVLLPRAFGRIAGVFGGFVGSFISWAGGQVLSLLQIIFEVVAPGAMTYLRRAAGAFRSVIQNPVGFIGNLVRAGIQGLRQFAGNFLSHLGRSLVEWLTGAMGGANLYIPRALNLPEILKFVLSVLGLTWANIRGKLVRVIPEPAVRALETGFDLVVRLVRDGPAAAWEQILQGLNNLREMVIGQITSFVSNRVVQSAITTLVSSLNPVGGFIRAIIAIYDTIMFFVERLRTIGRVVAAVIDSFVAIASGNIGTAASRVEQTMAGMLTLVISFLARIARLGNVSEAVTNIINRIRAPIDRALDRVVEWIVNLARRAGRFIAQAGVPQDPNERLNQALVAAVKAVSKFDGKSVGAVVLRPLLAAIRLRYGLTSLDVVKEGQFWTIEGVINPKGKKATGVKAGLAQGSSTARIAPPPSQGIWEAGESMIVDSERSGMPVDLVAQSHASKSTYRAGSGHEVQSMHLVPTTAVRHLPQYSRSSALTVLGFREQHGRFDRHWLDQCRAINRANPGVQNELTVAEWEIMLNKALESVPEWQGRVAGTLSFMIRVELYQTLGLTPTDMLRVPTV